MPAPPEAPPAVDRPLNRQAGVSRKRSLGSSCSNRGATSRPLSGLSRPLSSNHEPRIAGSISAASANNAFILDQFPDISLAGIKPTCGKLKPQISKRCEHRLTKNNSLHASLLLVRLAGA